MTRAEAVKQLRTLGTVAVRDLAVPAVIRPRRDGRLFFPRGRRAWYRTAGAAADALLAGEHRGGMAAALSYPVPMAKRLFPVLWAPAGYLIPGSRLPGQAPRGHCQRSRQAAQRALHR